MAKQNSMLNVLKGIGCFGVVFIHARFPGMFGDIVWRLAQFAVPMFFMISGYYAYSLDRTKAETMLIRRTKRILCISIVSTGMYLLIQVLISAWEGLNDYCLLGGDVRWFVIRLAKFLLLQNTDFTGGFHLWFLWALLYDYVILIFIYRRDSWNLFHNLIGILLFVTIFLHFARFYWKLDGHIDGNWFWGLSYVLMGHLIASRRDVLDQLTNAKLWLIAAFGGFISLVGLTNPPYDFTEFGIVLLSIALFSIAVKNPSAGSKCWMATVGEKYALYIYILHPFIKWGITKTGGREFVPWIYPLAVAGLSWAVASIIVEIQNKRNPSKVVTKT